MTSGSATPAGAVFVNIDSASPRGGLIVDVGGSSGPPNPAVTAELGTYTVAVDLPHGRP